MDYFSDKEHKAVSVKKLLTETLVNEVRHKNESIRSFSVVLLVSRKTTSFQDHICDHKSQTPRF